MSSPPSSASWMQDNLSWLKDHPIGEILWLPGSHNAGMNAMAHSIGDASEASSKAQSLDVYRQLMCGVRWFDIRAMNNGLNYWRCGHYVQSNQPGILWKGAVGMSINDLIDQVNRFTEQYKELIVIRISGFQNFVDGSPSTFVEKLNLLTLLYDGLDYVRTNDPGDYSSNAKGGHPLALDHDEDFLKYPLDRYIGHGDACVIVTAKPTLEPEPEFDPWQVSQRYRTDYDQKISSLVVDQTDLEIVSIPSLGKAVQDKRTATPLVSAAVRTLGKVPSSLLELAQACQNYALLSRPQSLVEKTGGPENRALGGIFQMDNIVDDTPLTLCLAASLAQWQTLNLTADRDHLIVVYGAEQVTDSGVLQTIRDQIQNRGKVFVDDKQMKREGAQHEILKSCVIYYSELRRADSGQGLFWQGRFAYEGQEVDFSTGIDKLHWHEKPVDWQVYRHAYTNLFTAIQNRALFIPSVKHDFPGFDPNPGRIKDVVVQYRTSSSPEVLKQRRIREGYITEFSNEIDWIEYHGQRVPHPECYEAWFWKMDRQRTVPMKIDNEVMGRPGEPFDPAPGTLKQMRMQVRIGGAEPKIIEAMEGEDVYVR